MSAKGHSTPLALIRHGTTEWNTDGRIQGSTDIPLSEIGRAEVRSWKVPAEFRDFVWISSPLARARQTAALLGADSVAIEPRIREMDWDQWEGLTLADLRKNFAAELAAKEARGVDFHAPGGESPRQVMARIELWLADIAEAGKPTVAVTHKGVVRAALALATGWDMLDKWPVEIDWSSVHLFAVDGEGRLTAERLNIAMAPP
ncbi:MAG: histidine phosphatase family protein [Proteobacteria bacterium]|nr:histidine phosphatase family protein [Pseudomonadota bacterium]